MKALTARQQEVLDFIVSSTKQNGFPPTNAEIADQFNFNSVNSAFQHVQRLKQKGRIEIRPGAHRGISVVP